MQTSNFPRLTYDEAVEIMEVSIADTHRSIILLGVPGIGKSVLPRVAATLCNREAVYFDLGNGAREDAVMPVIVDDGHGGKSVVQIPLNALRRACEAGVVLVIDEITRCDRNKQAVAMMLAHDRRIGSYVLHPDTTVILLGNGLESAGTTSLNDALINRCGVYELCPAREDVLGMLATLGPDGSTMRKLLVKLSAIAGIRTELVQITPPDGAQENCTQWASPRQWENGAMSLGAWLDKGKPMSATALKMLSSYIGSAAAAAFFAVLANENKLPTEAEVLADPANVKLPPDLESGIAALGLLKLVAAKGMPGANAAWIYLGRWDGDLKEMQAAGSKGIMGKVPSDKAAFAVFSKLAGRTAHIAARAR